MESDVRKSISALCTTEDDLLSSYHEEKSEFLESIFTVEKKPKVLVGNSLREVFGVGKLVTCLKCLNKVSSLLNHVCTVITADGKKNLSVDEKESLRKYEIYGCLGIGCSFRSNKKGKKYPNNSG